MDILNSYTFSIKMYPDEYYDKRILLSADFLLCTNRKSISKTEHNTNISLYNTAIKKSCFIAVMPWSGMWQNEKTTWFLEFATWFFDFTIRFSEFTTWFLEFTTWFFQFIIRFLEFTISVFQFTTWFFEFTLWFFKFAIRSTQSSGHHIYKIINPRIACALDNRMAIRVKLGKIKMAVSIN